MCAKIMGEDKRERRLWGNVEEKEEERLGEENGEKKKGRLVCAL